MVLILGVHVALTHIRGSIESSDSEDYRLLVAHGFGVATIKIGLTSVTMG